MFGGHDDWSVADVEDEWMASTAGAPDVSIVAREGAEVCGVALCTAEDDGDGFVEALGVRAPWWAGAALLREALRRLWAAGQRSFGVGVDGHNLVAIRLYERARDARRLDRGTVRARGRGSAGRYRRQVIGPRT